MYSINRIYNFLQQIMKSFFELHIALLTVLHFAQKAHFLSYQFNFTSPFPVNSMAYDYTVGWIFHQLYSNTSGQISELWYLGNSTKESYNTTMGQKITNLQFWPMEKLASIRDMNGAINVYNVRTGMNQSATPIFSFVDKAIGTKAGEVLKIKRILKQFSINSSTLNSSFTYPLESLLDFTTDGLKSIVMTSVNSSTNKLYIYNHLPSFAFYNSYQYQPGNCGQHKNIRTHGNLSNYFLIICSNYVEVRNINDTVLVTKINLTPVNSSDIISDAIICNNLLFVICTQHWEVYEDSNFSLILTSNFSNSIVADNMKCFSAQNKVGYFEMKGTSMAIRFINISIIPIIYDTAPIIVNQTVHSAPPILSTTAQQILQMSSAAKSMILSDESKSSAGITSSIAGFTSAAAVTKPILRPIVNVLEDLWFYGFHQRAYPEFVELFTKEVDTLNQLRIKPSFIDYEVEISEASQANDKLIQIGLLQSRAPSNQFMLQSVKDIYTTNLIMTLASFTIIRLLCFCLKKIRRKFCLFHQIYCFLQPGSFWWSLLIAFLESNIVPIVFYGALQFNAFICFDFFTKYNLVATLLLFFLVQTYAFLFYPFIFRYGGRSSRQKVSEFGEGTIRSFWLEMGLKCTRAFFQSLIHGIFINAQMVQLLGLMLLDLSMIVIIILLRKMFASKAILISILLFFIMFLAFDTTLTAYTIQTSNQENAIQNETQVGYNFAFIIIIVSLIVITLLRLIITIVISIIQLISSLKQSNKIRSHKENKQQQVIKLDETATIRLGKQGKKVVKFKKLQRNSELTELGPKDKKWIETLEKKQKKRETQAEKKLHNLRNKNQRHSKQSLSKLSNFKDEIHSRNGLDDKIEEMSNELKNVMIKKSNFKNQKGR